MLHLSITLDLRRIRYFFVALFVLEALIALFNLRFTPSEAFNRLMEVDAEPTFPTWFSGIQLFLMSLTALYAWKTDAVQNWTRWVWLILAAAFMFLSVDEVALIHETYGASLYDQYIKGSMQKSHWVLIYIPFMLVGVSSLFVYLLKKLGGLRLAQLCVIIGLILWIVVPFIELVPRQADDFFTSGMVRASKIIEEVFEMCGATFIWLSMALWIISRLSVEEKMHPKV